jgi:hypothetical protein
MVVIYIKYSIYKTASKVASCTDGSTGLTTGYNGKCNESGSDMGKKRRVVRMNKTIRENGNEWGSG